MNPSPPPPPTKLRGDALVVRLDTVINATRMTELLWTSRYPSISVVSQSAIAIGAALEQWPSTKFGFGSMC